MCDVNRDRSRGEGEGEGEGFHVEMLTVIVHRLKEQYPKIQCA